MFFSKTNRAMALALICILANSALAAQGGQRRVLTNEDVEAAPPAAAPVSSEPKAPVPASADAAQPAPQPMDKPAAPQTDVQQTDVQRLETLMDGIREAYVELGARIQAGSDDQASVDRWVSLRDSLGNALGEFRRFLEQAQAKAKRAAAPAASPASAESQPPSQPAAQ